jgi:hypothetical protein
MKLRVLFSLVVLLTTKWDIYAQYSEDALRFSRSQWGSTARFKAIGAHTGVGGDLSSVGANPAGIGLFTGSELSITPEFNSHNNSSNYLSQQNFSRGDKLGLANAAIVFHSRLGKPKGARLDQGWLSFNFGLGYNQTQGFENSLSYSGTNPNNSIADYFAESATNIFGAPNTLQSGSLERMAYDNYLIGYDSRDRFYFPETDVNNVQTKNDLRFGRQSEVNFSFGANYSNKFYVGASIGIANINYNTSDIYEETGFNVTENNDYQLSYRQSQLTRGSGINGKIGALYRPVPNVRIGATVESPTWYTIDDSYSEGLDTKYGKNRVDSQFVNDDEIYDFTYNLRTPLKISTGISYFFGDQGFISADIDYIDYSTINFAQATTDDIQVISDNNRAVMSNFKDAINFRIGAEYKIDKLMLRAGYGSQGDPYVSTDNKSFNISTFSGGIGYRINKYYIDMTYQKVVSNSERWPYSLNDVPTSIANIRNNRNNIFLTVGSRF